MNILVTGASGLVGSALVPHLARAGHKVAKLNRSRPGKPAEPPCWNPDTGTVDLSGAGPLEAVIHLAGENIAQRWTAAAKARIRESRVRGTQLISAALAKLQPRPELLVSASAMGYYGHRDDEILTEASRVGSGFLADVCRDWEAATKPAAESGIRVANLRFGVILAREGGALRKMLPAFRAGIAGRLGSGQQYWSWISLDDVLRVIDQALGGRLAGPVNVVSPHPVTNREFTKTLARVLRRPAIFPLPAFVLKMIFGDMAREAFLASARVLPRKLLDSGFQFADPDLEPALRRILQRR